MEGQAVGNPPFIISVLIYVHGRGKPFRDYVTMLEGKIFDVFQYLIQGLPVIIRQACVEGSSRTVTAES